MASPYLPAVIVFVLVVLCAVFADNQKRRIAEENLRSEVTEQLSLIRARLEGKINGNIQLIQGLVTVMAADPQISEARFTDLSRRIFKVESQIRTLAAAPDLTIRMIYPLKGNENALGHDYKLDMNQAPAVFQVRDTGRMSVTGPVNLVQGGMALIARYPVINDTPLHEQKFWGIVSAVIDLQRLYRDSGLLAADLPIDVAIASDDAAGQYGIPFFGEALTLRTAPVEMGIDLGRETWRIAAVPKGGWDRLPPDILTFRLLTLLVGSMVIAPLIWAGRLTGERQRNIAALQQREEQLKAVSQRLEIALKTSRIGIWEYDVASNGLIWDERMRELYGVAADKVVCDYDDWLGALHPDDAQQARAAFAETFKVDSSYESEFRLLLKNGEVRHIRSIGRAYADASGGLKIIGVNWNVTDDITLQIELRKAKGRAEMQNGQLEQARVQMEYNALHDALTKLPNRRFLDQVLAEKAGGAAGQPPVTVLHFDLDRFKEINDTLGHAAGDEILKHSAAILKANISEDDFVARIGGDEFVIVSEVPDIGGHYVDLANRIIEALRPPIVVEGHQCRAGVSIGIASQAGTPERTEQLLINADIALYEAKRRGRNRCELFTDALRSTVVHTKQTADEIQRGLERNEFIAYFQPQFDAHSLEITGVEALVRWDHPVKGIVAPVAFLKIAENLNVVSTIDQIVLEQALLHSHRWLANGLDIPKVSVNISAQRLHDQSLFERLEALQIRPGSLCFELLESISFDDHDELLVNTIQRIKALGIDIEIDDFGTGHASITSLLKLTPRRLKIDRQLIKPILTSSTERKLVSSMIEIGKTCGIEIVAEGVETMAHAALLRDLGCHHLQGYAFAKPMSGDEFLDFARSRRWLDAADPTADGPWLYRA